MRKLVLRVERRRLLSAMIALTFCLSAMLGLLVTSSSDRTDAAVRESPTAAKTLTLTVHAPILIDGNAGFTNASGVVWGSGTSSDPYIISGWDIDTLDVYGIEIRNVDAHFIIRDCYIHESLYGNRGVFLNFCVNGILSNNTFSDTGISISLYHSSNNIISNNTCSDNYNGVEITSGSNNNTVSNNNCSNNIDPMRLWGSSNNIISNNTFSDNYRGISFGGMNNIISNNIISNSTCWGDNNGIALYDSSNNTLSGNTVINGGMMIRGDSLSHWNTQSIDTSNTVNGKPIRYYRNQSGITVPSGAGEVILANCTNMVIENQNLSDALGGIEIGFSSNITIMNNTFLNNTLLFGIDIYYSTFTLLGNNTSSDYYGGIHLTSSSNNSLSNNNCRIVLSSSSNNIISNNTCSKYGGILLEYCSNSNTLTNNNCSNNYRYGICISQSSGNTLSNNNCSSNSEDGMYLYLSSFNTISNNTFSLNPMHGINSDGSNGNVIQMNLFLSNGVRGMILWASTQNEIWNNTFIGNNGAGGTYDPSHIQARDDCSGNWWNSTDGYGNYWSDWTTPDAIPPWGVVDHPYLLDGSAGAEDYYPLTTTPSEPIPEFGMMPFVVMVLLATTVLTMRAWRRKAQ